MFSPAAIRFQRRWLLALACYVGMIAPATAEEPGAGAVDFTRDIRPIFAARCYACHGPEKQEGGLRLNVRASAYAGGDSGHKAIVPGDLSASRLWQLVSGANPDERMPPEGEGEPLTAAELDLVSRWIRTGAAWPPDVDTAGAQGNHWAWRKPVKAALPEVRQADWPKHALDYFVLGQMQQAGLAPAPEADRYTLVRRVHLDLIGLPPTPAAVAQFVDDAHPEAYARMVDRVLADPAYGERWARVWLDLARYADSKGYGSDPLRVIWRYRDWVIEAFNRNLPYNQFTIEQLAGDLLPNPTPDQLLATAFHRNTMANDEGGTDDEEFRVAAVKDRIETTMQVWMGLTMGCAKCHSHKFDPITQREYYQGYAFFNQTEDADRGDEEPRLKTPSSIQAQQISDRQAQIAAIQQQIATPPANLDAEVSAWEQQHAAEQARWQVITPTSVKSAAGTKFNTLPDGSLLASGLAGETDTVEVTLEVNHPHVTGLRLEVLPDDALPARGPGQAGGNFVLSELALASAPAGPPSTARYVRVELPGDNRILALAEVQVFAGNENIAPQGKASQSSTAFQGPAELAVDGRTDGDFDNKSVTHTAEEKSPWWEVDLGKATTIDRVVLWNRTDNDLQSRLKDCRVVVLDETRQVLWQQTTAEAPRAELELSLTAPTKVDLKGASADFEQASFPASAAIDGDVTAKSGWAITPEVGRAHQAVFATSKPLTAGAATKMTVTLIMAHGGRHTLGRFRLAVTGESVPPPALLQAIDQILATSAANRSEADRSALTAYFWSQSPTVLAARSQIAAIEEQIKKLESEVSATPVLRELATDKRRETRTMIKGNYLAPGDVVEPAVPAAFHPLPQGAPVNRLGLARWLVDADNPLTARVAVNRMWAQLFGVGLVATEEDFGTQGLPPTHPEVLDWLAVEFRTSGWDMKDLLKQIVMSATYRQSSTPGPAALERDPPNRYLSRGPRARLEAEMVRDQALAIAGLLSRTQGGPSVYPPQPPNLWRAAFNGQRTWATSEGDDRYRRGLYTYWRRTVPYPSMAAFDAPSREICTLRRISTNTPLQAFVTLNDPVYIEAAQALARRLVAEGGATADDRAAYGLLLALSRPAQSEQVAPLVALYQATLEEYRKDPAAAAQMSTEPLGPLPTGYDPAELASWTVVANVILNLDGVLTKR